MLVLAVPLAVVALERDLVTWWEILLIVAGSMLAGAAIAYLATMIYIGKGMWQ